jgi:hypothetical protein
MRSWSLSGRWKLICAVLLFEERIAAMLSQMNLTICMHMRPDLWSVPRTASPATIPLGSDLYDIMESLDPSSGPQPAKKMSSFGVEISQM